MINGETLEIALGMIGMGLCIATLPYLINDNCDLYEEQHNVLGLINASAASGMGLVATILCSIKIISSIIFSVVCITLLILSVLNSKSRLRLKIANGIMWGSFTALCII